MAEERLQKILSRAGYGSRRACEGYITAGRVKVNGVVKSELGSRADSSRDTVAVDGEKLRQEKPVYYLLNKPKGVICSNSLREGCTRAVDIIADNRRLFTAGRLDSDTTGLIIVTNDGDFANRVCHPRYEVEKTYVAKVKGSVSDDAVEKMKRGIFTDQGRMSVKSVHVSSSSRESSVLTVRIREGQNRQVRRILAAVGLDVRALARVKIGPLEIGNLRPGDYRRLRPDEIAHFFFKEGN